MHVEDLKITREVNVVELLNMMGRAGGFMATHMAEAFDILVDMLSEKRCLRILSFTGNLVATGLRGVLTDMLRRKLFDVVVTTCGALDHDIARTFSYYEHGGFDVDDAELRNRGYHRLGNVFIKAENYGELIENRMRDFLGKKKPEGRVAVYKLLWDLGSYINNQASFLYWCSRNKIPVIVPGIVDGAVGYQLWQFSQNEDFILDIMQDEKLMSDLMWEAEKTGALIIGGGVSKHHVIWWSQFAGEGLDYAIYLTTADEYDGSLSGARPKEAISWRKISTKSRHIFVKGDATVTLPLLYLALLQKLKI